MANERRQVAEAEDRVRRLTGKLETAAEIAAALAAVFALLGATLLLRRLSQPIDQLTRGTQKLAAGELSHRIEASGRDEFAQLARRFNGMAADLERQRAQLEDARNTLETKVEARTEELRRANEELQQTDRIRQRFFAEISHELRTPLTILRGEGEVSLLGSERPVESYKASIGRMVDQTEHLSRLVDDLFLMARSSAGVADLKRKEVDVSDLSAPDLRRHGGRRRAGGAEALGPGRRRFGLRPGRPRPPAPALLHPAWTTPCATAVRATASSPT